MVNNEKMYSEEEVKKDIAIMYSAFRMAYFDGEVDERMDSVLDKYGLVINEDGYLDEE